MSARMMILPGMERKRLAAKDNRKCRDPRATRKGQAIAIARRGLAHVKYSRTRKKVVAMGAIAARMGSLLS
jgi:hypothetical protein